MIRVLRFLTLVFLIGGMVRMWQTYQQSKAELRREREREAAGPVQKLLGKVSTVRGQMHDRMHEHMRDHMRA